VSNETVVCWLKCYACLHGYCFDPPRAHGWASYDDVLHARYTNQLPPIGLCACNCTKDEETE
jgi:hypothetical protein